MSDFVAMQTLDLVRPDATHGDFVFKHALVREVLYQGVLTEPRTALHARIAEEIERRSGNRLLELAEVLAHHYSQTNLVDKAFTYLAMAGSKSLAVYSLDEAASHLTAALRLMEKNPDCASDAQLAEFLISYTSLLGLNDEAKLAIDVVESYLPRVDRLGDDARSVLIRYNYVYALWWNSRFRDAASKQREMSLVANRLGDSRSKAYSLAMEI